jgi:hypothetical protein
MYKDEADIYYKGSFNGQQQIEENISKKASLAVLPQYDEYENNMMGGGFTLQHNSSQ